MSWKDYDEIYLSPRHEAMDKIEREHQREELDARMSEWPYERENMNIKIDYKEGNNGALDMVSFNGGLINCGGRTLPF